MAWNKIAQGQQRPSVELSLQSQGSTRRSPAHSNAHARGRHLVRRPGGKGAPRSPQRREKRRSRGFWLAVCGCIGELLEAGSVSRGAGSMMRTLAAASIFLSVIQVVIRSVRLPAAVLQFRVWQRRTTLQGACQMQPRQTPHFPRFTNAAERSACLNAGHCAFEEHGEVGEGRRMMSFALTGPKLACRW
jgi:hypothetical protein